MASIPISRFTGLLALLAGCSRDHAVDPQEFQGPPPVAQATSVTCDYTGDSHPVLSSGFHNIGLTLCSTHFPSGSAERSAVDMAVAHLNAITNSSLYFYVVGTEVHTDYDETFEDDNVNKLDFVDPNDCDCSDAVFDGRTIIYGDTSGDIDEFDIGFDENESWAFGSPTSWELSDGFTYLRSVLLHEIGHGLGFEHSASVTPDLSIMGGKNGKWLAMKKVGIKAYDYGHVRYHYGDSADDQLADLVLSNYRTEDNSGTYSCVLNEGVSDSDVTPGQVVNLTWTRMNLGDRTAVNNYYTTAYLSADEDGATGYKLLKTWFNTADVAAHSTLYTGISVTIPTTTAPGTYYVVLKIDLTDTVHEHREDNNMLVIHQSLTVG